MPVDQYFILLQVTHVIPLLIAALRYRKIDASFRPFILLLLLGFINETINYVSIKLFKNSSISFNVFHIIECLLLFYQFRVWGFFRNKFLYRLLVIGAIAAWAGENFLLSTLLVPNTYFRILYAFVIELMIVNRLIYVANEKTRIAKNAKFLICIGLIILYMYQIIFEGALLSRSPLGETSALLIRAIGYTDVLVQLLFSWALLVAETKHVLLWEKKMKAIE